MWTVRLIFLWAFAVGAAYFDLRHRRVPNRLILSATAVGMTLAAIAGWGACRAGLCGMALGFALLLPAFLLRMVGGGDVKSLAVIGLATGPGLLWVSFLRGTVVGGLAGLVVLAARRLRRSGADNGEPEDAWTLPYAGILSACAALSFLLA